MQKALGVKNLRKNEVKFQKNHRADNFSGENIENI